LRTLLTDLGPLDWETDFRGTAAATQDALRALAADPEQLQGLLCDVENKPELLDKSERLRLDDKIVLYDALDTQGFRLRLHISKNEDREVAHNHRFSITTLILRGVYYHKLYLTEGPFGESADADSVRPVFLRDERAGACYTMHHSVIESNTTAPGTMSLLMRGPTMKARAAAVERATGQKFFKYGATDEPAEVRDNVRMTVDEYRALRARVCALMDWPVL
jgi:hypothetical protein